jgi:hypothetical protein
LGGNGYSEMLVWALLTNARRDSFERVSLNVDISNNAAASLYVKLGFADAERPPQALQQPIHGSIALIDKHSMLPDSDDYAGRPHKRKEGKIRIRCKLLHENRDLGRVSLRPVRLREQVIADVESSRLDGIERCIEAMVLAGHRVGEYQVERTRGLSRKIVEGIRGHQFEPEVVPQSSGSDGLKVFVIIDAGQSRGGIHSRQQPGGRNPGPGS